MEPQPQPRDLRFEEALQRLDQIVAAMESGEIGVEECVARYEEAMALAAHCRKILDAAELRIQAIQLDSAGKPQLTPFQPPSSGTAESSSDTPVGDRPA